MDTPTSIASVSSPTTDAIKAANASRQTMIRQVLDLVYKGGTTNIEAAKAILAKVPRLIELNGKNVEDRTDGSGFTYHDLCFFGNLYEDFKKEPELDKADLEKEIEIMQNRKMQPSEKFLRTRITVLNRLEKLERILLLIDSEIQVRKEVYHQRINAERAAAAEARYKAIQVERAQVRPAAPRPVSKWVTDKVISKAEAVKLVGSEEKLSSHRLDSKINASLTLLVLGAESRLVYRMNGAAIQYAIEKRV